MSFTEKRIELTITLGSGTFGEDVGDTVTLRKFRMVADLINPGGESMGSCTLRVYGLRNDVMNKLTTIGLINAAIKAKNTIALAAGDDESGYSTVFSGTIFDAWADYNSSPDVAFNIIAYAGLDTAVRPVDATSYKGVTDVAAILQDIAVSQMGIQFENNGVDVKLSNPYLSGTALTKVRNVCRAASINFVIENNVLIIWSSDTARKGDKQLVSPETGMVGWPALSSKGMTVRMLFNPKIKLGNDIEVKSAIPMACRTWRVYSISHSLSSEIVDGPWFTTAEVGYGGQ